MVMPIWEIHMVLIYMVVQPNHLDNHKSHIYECNVLFFFISIIFVWQPMIYGRGPAHARMRMMPMVLHDARLGYVL